MDAPRRLVRGSHLALADASQVRSDELRPYVAQRRERQPFLARLLDSPREQNWSLVPGMGRGMALIFDSVRAPHAAVSPEHEAHCYRSSVEVRHLLVRRGVPAVAAP